MFGVRKWIGCAALLMTCLGLSEPAVADEAGPTEHAAASKKVAVGFSNLVARLDTDEIGFAKAEFRVHILEVLRAAGFNAVGAENLVFGKDEAERADVVLGGTVKELQCRKLHDRLRCGVGIEWQLLDRERDEVVYRVLSRYVDLDLPLHNDSVVGRRLVLGALSSLMGREGFIRLLNAERLPLPDDDDFQPATFAACAAAPRELPADFDEIANGTVIINSGASTGSGFTVSPDGLIMTAAHVVSTGKVKVHARDGKIVPARVVRISHKQDVALVSVGALEKPQPCLAIEPESQTPGADVYAIGSPGGEELGFSLSRGIVSGLRTIGDLELIQTDASISPGNSGGPLVSRQGRVVGVVSRKIAEHAFEGLGFAIPIHAGLTALKLEPGSSSTPSLVQALPVSVATVSKRSVTDRPDPKGSLDPEGDHRRALAEDYARRLREQDAGTPGYVVPLRVGGVCLALAGVIGAAATGLGGTNNLTRSEYESLRLKNDLSWTGVVLGLGAFATSYLLVPDLGPPSVARARRWFLAAGPNNLRLNVRFQ
jgi:S1-C subfamily serine protease